MHAGGCCLLPFPLPQARRTALQPEQEEEGCALGRQAADLATGLRDVSELYNDYAQPYKVWPAYDASLAGNSTRLG